MSKTREIGDTVMRRGRLKGEGTARRTWKRGRMKKMRKRKRKEEKEKKLGKSSTS